MIMKKKILFVLMTMVCLVGCGGDEEDEPAKLPAKIDPALTGVWAQFSGPDKNEIEEAVSFEPDGEVLILCEPFGGFPGGWWAGNYEKTSDGHLVFHVFQAKITKFTWFDDYNAWAANPTTHDWYFTYSISNKVLTLKHEAYNKTFVLELIE